MDPSSVNRAPPQTSNSTTVSQGGEGTNSDGTWKPRSVAIYCPEEKDLIGEGTYGSVMKGRLPGDPNTRVALKKIRKEKKEGFPITAIREIKILKYLNHPNIVKLLDVVSSHEGQKEGDGGDVYMVFEFCDHDLTGLMESTDVKLTEAQVKYYMKSILEGLHYCHSNNILHRDIKGANVLVSNNGDVKLADFGLARIRNRAGEYTNRVVTLWYRPPELLLGETKYSSKIDIWSAGCLFAELLTEGAVLFPGNNTELDQLNKIYEICGTPTKEDWPEVENYKAFQSMRPIHRAKRLRTTLLDQSAKNVNLGKLGRTALDLLEGMLALNPEKRFSAEQCLEHEYFFIHPKPMTLDDHVKMMSEYKENFHEYNSKRKRKQREQRAQNGTGQGAPGGHQRSAPPAFDPNRRPDKRARTNQYPPHSGNNFAPPHNYGFSGGRSAGAMVPPGQAPRNGNYSTASQPHPSMAGNMGGGRAGEPILRLTPHQRGQAGGPGGGMRAPVGRGPTPVVLTHSSAVASSGPPSHPYGRPGPPHH